MIARAGRERPGWRKVSIFIEIPLSNDFDCPGCPGTAWEALFVNPTEYSLCREHYYGGHSEGPGGVLLKVWILAKKSKKVEILVDLRPILGKLTDNNLDPTA